MHYYLIALLKSPLAPLTYASSTLLSSGSLVQIALNKRDVQGVVLEEVSKPDFECSLISVTCKSFYTSKTLNWLVLLQNIMSAL